MQSTIERAALPPVAIVLRGQVRSRLRSALAPYEGGVYSLVSYRLGMTDEAGRPAGGAGRKLLPPVLCLVAASGFGPHEQALDAAVAIELMHAFSLVHDDIEDGDELRRTVLRCGRSTASHWRSMPATASSPWRTECSAMPARLPPDAARDARRVFNDTALRMIEGQHRDLAFESRSSLTLAEYETMASGKTGALLGAALALGAICGRASRLDVGRLREAGVQLGLAFQAVDDALAIWGDAALTGKPAGNDVARGKKSLPVVLATAAGTAVAERSLRGRVTRIAAEHAERAHTLIASTAISAEAAGDLEALASFMLHREI